MTLIVLLYGQKQVTNTYYVYKFLRDDGTPYYIGKGSGDRAYRKRTKGIKLPKDANNIVLIQGCLTETEAFDLEIDLIKQYGRKNNNTGILLNQTDGGEGVSGRNCQGSNNNFYGLKHSNTTKKKWNRKGSNNPMHGRSAPQEQNLRWYNDGTKNIYVSEGTQPHNFRLGRIIKQDSLGKFVEDGS